MRRDLGCSADRAVEQPVPQRLPCLRTWETAEQVAGGVNDRRQKRLGRKFSLCLGAGCGVRVRGRTHDGGRGEEV